MKEAKSNEKKKKKEKTKDVGGKIYIGHGVYINAGDAFPDPR